MRWSTGTVLVLPLLLHTQSFLVNILKSSDFLKSSLFSHMFICFWAQDYLCSCLCGHKLLVMCMYSYSARVLQKASLPHRKIFSTWVSDVKLFMLQWWVMTGKLFGSFFKQTNGDVWKMLDEPKKTKMEKLPGKKSFLFLNCFLKFWLTGDIKHLWPIICLLWGCRSNKLSSRVNEGNCCYWLAGICVCRLITSS